eukprot:15018434-Alexandrium_andersonii.AAC.1
MVVRRSSAVGRGSPSVVVAFVVKTSRMREVHGLEPSSSRTSQGRTSGALHRSEGQLVKWELAG